jgi:hypothetical protein
MLADWPSQRADHASWATAKMVATAFDTFTIDLDGQHEVFCVTRRSLD